MKPQKTFLKSILILCVLCALCGFALTGCEQTSAERIAEVKKVIDDANAASSSLDVSIAQIEPVIANLKLALGDPNIPEDIKPAAAKALEAALQRLNQLKAYKHQVDSAMADAKRILDTAAAGGDIGLTAELQTYGSLISAAGAYVPQPYGGYLYLGGMLVAALGGLIGSIVTASQKNKQLKKSEGVLREVVVSVDKLLTSPAVTDTEAAKTILEKSQSSSTQNVVDAIRQPARVN
ncbi:MAG: hypothetical protein WC877_03285 [Dehalococcoidales bacterium]|jgi:hypothetical protein|nr:hypothetical protein [Candidatus Neomarinimicrobiota bacterium]